MNHTIDPGRPPHEEGEEGTSSNGRQDFIRAIVAEDLRIGKHGGAVVTRFPPEPNGYLHIGHAKSIGLNFGIAAETGGVCHLRFDDTNPETEDEHYVRSIQEDVRWLGFDWGSHLYFAADYFDHMYRFAEFLIAQGLAYVDSSTEEEIREARGTVTEPGRPTRYRDRPVEDNLELFRRMRDGEFPDGAHVLRAKIDLSSSNMLLRDPLIYRIRHAHHYRSGDKWCIYPLYDYAHPIEDAIEGITHSFCTLEFDNNRAVYDWVVDHWQGFVRSEGGVPARPHQYEFARGNLDYTVMSKRKLLELVRGGYVSGWDDPRMPTIAGLRRRGVTPEAIRAFWERTGVAKFNSRVDIGKLEFAIRDDLNQRSPRVLCVLDPLKVTITNYPEDTTEELDAPYYPHDVPLEGERKLPFGRTIFIERDDFREDPPKGFFRLAPGREVRLRYAYMITCEEVVRDEGGRIVELRCSYDPSTRGGNAPDGRVVKGTIHWVSTEHALRCEVRLYDRLFTVADPEAGDDDFKAHLNPESLVMVQDAYVEPSVRNDPPGSRYQFERLGYFCSDPVDSSPERLVFSRTVTLRDTWARATQARNESKTDRARETRGKTADRPGSAAAPAADSRSNAPVMDVPRSPELELRRARYESELGLASEEAEILTRETSTADLFESALAAQASPKAVANWIVHELPRGASGRAPEDLPFSGAELGGLARLVEDGVISSSAGREVLAEMVDRGGDPAEIVEQRGLRQVSDPDLLAPLVEELVAANSAKAEEYRNGKTGLLGFFMGQLMRRAGGRANPEVAKQLLERRLSG